MANDHESSDLDVFDAIASKNKPADSQEETQEDTLETQEETDFEDVTLVADSASALAPKMPTVPTTAAGSLAAAARLSSPSASRLPPPPPSFPARGQSPSSTGAAALFAGSGRVSGSLPPPVVPPRAPSMPSPAQPGSVPPPVTSASPRTSALPPPPPTRPSASAPPPPTAASPTASPLPAPRPPMGSLRPMTVNSASEPAAPPVVATKPKSRAKFVLLAAALFVGWWYCGWCLLPHASYGSPEGLCGWSPRQRCRTSRRIRGRSEGLQHLALFREGPGAGHP